MNTHFASLLAVLFVWQPANCAQPGQLDAQKILEQTKNATALILAGEGAGRLHSIATGAVVSATGIILTANHAIKGAAEVQVRLPNGEIFDKVELLGVDERRDVAALKIPARLLSALTPGNTQALAPGDTVYAVTNAGGLTWSAAQGILSAIRPADEVPGAGSGYRLLQFTAPVAPGSSGGALVDSSGAIIGIITRGGASAGFAVPVDAVLGLSEAGHSTTFGSGSFLQLPANAVASVPQSSAAIAGADPKQILKEAKAIFLQSKTAFLTVDTLDRALARNKDWSKLGLTIVQDPRVADLSIQLDRPLFTYIHTFVIVDKKTSIVLGTGKVTAFDGSIASGRLAHDIIAIFLAARLPNAGK